VSGDVHARFCERPRGQFLRPTHLVITVRGHHTKRSWAARALLRLQEHLTRLGVEVNREKTTVVDMIRGETFTFLGFEVRRVRKRTGDGHSILLTPRKKARLTLKARVRELLHQGGGQPHSRS